MPEFNRGRNPQGQRAGGSRQGAPSGRPNTDRSQRHGGTQVGGGGAKGEDAQRAAMPWYVGDNFSEAPPGHRYLMYLPFWKRDWSAVKEGKQQVLKTLGAIPPHTREAMSALAQRQRNIGKGIGAEVIEAVSTSPFATGLGWEHPNENGFAFLQPYGLPYLAGSGVKGVVRRAAQELAEECDGDNKGWVEDAIDALFGLEPPPGSDEAARGALRFFDTIPEIVDNRMGVDIMNPHYGDYYQGKSSPHDAGSPVPIFFLVVPPNSKFCFVVDCPREHLLPNQLRGAGWRKLVRAAFEHAFDWLGFGAKTAVGYGAMQMGERRQGAVEQAAAVSVADQTSDARSVSPGPHVEHWPNAQLGWNKGTRELTASSSNKKAFSRSGQGQVLFDQLDEETQGRLSKGKAAFANVTVEAAGRNWLIASVEEPSA